VAVRVARQNAKQNRVADQIAITRTDLTRLLLRPKVTPYDLICANLIDTLLIENASRIVNRLKSDGRLVLSGILKTQFTTVQKTYERAGFSLIHSKAENEWRSGLFARHL
jgi:ribosomal protein L11 methyltransferase